MNENIKIFFILVFIFAVQGLEIPLSSNENHVFQEFEDDTFTDTDNQTKINYRLPTDVKPVHYTLKLTPHLDGEKKFTFDGTMVMDVKVLKKTTKIVFHAKNLTLTAVEMKIKSESPLNIAYSMEQETDFVKIERIDEKEFEEKDYEITIKYVGILADDLKGFYRSSYVNEKGDRVWLATTHFEPVNARQAFPCFDEPDFKATFLISIIHNKKYTALSNTQLEKNFTVVGTENVQSNFKKTPIMSSYLVAFVVSDFKNVGDSEKFAVYAKPNFEKFGTLALESGTKLLKALESFTGIEYEIGKMDQIAIPDFAAGAMENWGLVTYREKSLLFNKDVTTTSEKQNIVETIAHEFAHQWFGNLVSPKWWTYTWLNEGFANFFQSYITDKVYPEWRSVEQAVVKSIQTSAFDFDCESKTHPINHEVEKPEDIRELFDTISYKKGGAIIRMMQHFLTDEVFQSGLQNYLKKMSHATATSDDLFNRIQEKVDKSKGIDVKTIMNTWVDSKGYPVVKVFKGNDPNSVVVTQERFYTYNASEEEKKEKHYWHIPINFVTDNNLDFNSTTVQYWLTTESEKFSINENSSFIILNKQHTGYYRVQYEQENWNSIIKYLNSGEHNKIHVLNRAQLINDALAFTKQNQLEVSILLNLLDHLQNEIDYVAWYPAFKAFTFLKSKVINTETYSVFKDFASKRMKHLIESVGYEEADNEPETDYLIKMNRITAIDWACRLEVKLNETSCTESTKKKLESWLDKPTENIIPPDLKQVTLCGGLRNAKLETWEKAYNMSISSSTNADEKKQLISALACSSDKIILERYFNYSLKEKSPHENETLTIIKHIHENSEVGIDVALDLIINRLVAILIKNQMSKVSPVLLDVSKKITTLAQLEKLKNALNSDIPESVIAPAIEEAQKNFMWIKKNNDLIKNTIQELDGGNKNGSGGLGLYSTPILLISSLFILSSIIY